MIKIHVLSEGYKEWMNGQDNTNFPDTLILSTGFTPINTICTRGAKTTNFPRIKAEQQKFTNSHARKRDYNDEDLYKGFTDFGQKK
jgi:hypothetical protein